ncbi:MAG: malectin [Verrucomicrobiota bacterium]
MTTHPPMISALSPARSPLFVALLLSAGFTLCGCHTPHKSPAGCSCCEDSCSNAPAMTAAATAATAATAASETPASAAAPLPAPVRIDAGATQPYKDSAGNTWLADQGFSGGDVIERPSELVITNTPDPALYRTEHYGMDSFSWPVPNGKYILKLYFAETFEGVDGPGQRVFSVSAGGQEIKDLDVWAKTGGLGRPDIESLSVDVTNSKVDITFTRNIDSPEINAIEILPAP